MITFDVEFVAGARNLDLHASSALGVVASAQVWHALHALLVHVHITGCTFKRRSISNTDASLRFRPQKASSRNDAHLAMNPRSDFPN